MKKNLSALLGLVVGTTLIIVSILIDGNIMNFVSLSSVIVTMGGSFCALVVSFPLKDLVKIPAMLKMLSKAPENDRKELIVLFSEMARKARRDGLLALEDDMTSLEDEFLVSGLQMVVDGIDPDVIREILELKMGTTEQRHRMGQSIFSKWGELAPAFGMLGTLTGLIIMLSDLQDASAIGSGMAVALITTFYGSFLANMIFIPIANNLGVQTDEEMFTKEMTIEGILQIQAGTNPRILEEKLMTYLSPEEQLQMKTARVGENVEAMSNG
jgi:chemotaxis protein MotA